VDRPPILSLELFEAVNNPDVPVPEDRLDLYKTHYNLGTANVDKGIGEILGYLKELRIYDNTVIVVTSDHGEFLGEHRLFGHGTDIYEETLRIPLLIKEPGQRRGDSETTYVCCVDLPHLILERLATPFARRCMEMFPYQPGKHPVMAEQYYALYSLLESKAYGHRFRRVRRAVFDGPYKYIASSEGANELFNLKTDDEGAKNLAEAMPAKCDELQQQIAALVANGPSTPEIPPPDIAPAELDEGALEELEAIGYV
jgi:arylsulfatase A-like enzyme